ncbi:MAG: hypothetical protein SXV54_14110 [Chloroflexota bacterium]|nr:hypothetical protein [Chloroflexota bacterium]
MTGSNVAWSEGWLWLSSSLLIAVLWANLVWFFRQPRSGMVGEFVAPLASWHFSPWLLQFLRLLYYLGLPFAALLWGHDVLVGLLLGLQRFNLPISDGSAGDVDIAANWLDWAYDVGWTVALGIGAGVLLALGWWAYRRALTAVVEGDAVTGAESSGWVFLREAAYHEVHWAFYRNAPIIATGMYWGSWIGLALVALEATLNPAWRNRMADPQRSLEQLMRAALAVVSSIFFPLTQNLWLAIALHWGVSWGLARLAGTLALGISSQRQSQHN